MCKILVIPALRRPSSGCVRLSDRQDSVYRGFDNPPVTHTSCSQNIVEKDIKPFHYSGKADFVLQTNFDNVVLMVYCVKQGTF